jgi:predicted nucleic acid-binding protein
MKLPAALKGCKGAVLDTMVLIYLFEDHPRYGAMCECLVQKIEASEFTGIVTPITMAEVMVKPLRSGRPDIGDRYHTTVLNTPNVEICVLTWQTGVMAGALRAKYRMPLPDMFQVACAIEHGGVLVTNDHELKGVKDVHVVLLDDML